MDKKILKASLELGKLIRYHREKKGMTLADLSKKVGVSYIHLSYLEKGERIPSEELIRELAKIFADNKEEEIQLRQKMFLYLAQIKAPSEIAEKINISEQLYDIVSLAMPEPFLHVLQKVLKNKKNLYNNLDLQTAEKIDRVLEKRALLTRSEVIRIAEALQEDVDVFLLLAGYLPDKDIPTIIVSRNEVLANLFEKFKEVFDKGDKESAKKMIELMEGILKFMK